MINYAKKIAIYIYFLFHFYSMTIKLKTYYYQNKVSS